jgi:D-sedoheptulose 7-phosphate isomerase
MVKACNLEIDVQERLLERNRIFEDFFKQEASPLAMACQEMSDRFLLGGRLLVFGRGPYATDAQHVSVEFVHPIIVGKRALPALDLSLLFGPWLDTLLRPEDIVMGFGPPEGDAEVTEALAAAQRKGAMTFALPGREGSYAFTPPTKNPFVHQELMEILYHTLWETVHVFFEHRELGLDVGDSAFLYPFLGEAKQDVAGVVHQVAASIRAKAQEDSNLRVRMAREEAGTDRQPPRRAISPASWAQGGKLIDLSATGARPPTPTTGRSTASLPPAGYRKPIPAVSLVAGTGEYHRDRERRGNRS